MMKKFSLKASLLNGLSYRLETLDAQMVHDTLATVDPILSIRKCQGVVKKLNEANAEFLAEVTRIEDLKMTLFKEIKDKFDKENEGMSFEELKAKGKPVQAEFNLKAADIQKQSKAKPDELVTVELGDEDYDAVLMPLFRKTVQLWDISGDGKGQKTFLEVADSLEKMI
jgi:hypothetical protein